MLEVAGGVVLGVIVLIVLLCVAGAIWEELGG